MKFSDITVHPDEITDELDRINSQVEPAGVFEDACSAYAKVKPVVGVAIAILSAIYPPGAAAIATLKIIVEKACEGKVE